MNKTQENLSITPMDDNQLIHNKESDLVNGPNPWLPAYGFQQSHFQSSADDDDDNSRTNESTLVQQVDFLETILEETSDDLHSDSDRSGTTCWFGSDSETESVIHIKTAQKTSETNGSQSGSECNSVVPKKRRRKNKPGDFDNLNLLGWASPRSSRSSSSRSSSLVQFETLERTCATVSPSGYSYDSLELFTNNANLQNDNTSPDSLEADDNEMPTTRFALSINKPNDFTKIRPYKSFESLDVCHKNELMSDNDFSSLMTQKTSNDLRGHRQNSWSDNYDDEDNEYEADSDDLDNSNQINRINNYYDDEDDVEDDDRPRVLQVTFGDSYSTSLDYRNTIDLRDIGIEKKKPGIILDLARTQIGSTSSGLHQSILNLAAASNMASNATSYNHQRYGHHHHHHHHHHHQLHHHHHHHHQHHDDNDYNDNEDENDDNNGNDDDPHYQKNELEQDWNTSYFNFRPQSLPSLASAFNEFTTQNNTKNNYKKLNLFDNYTKVTSLPIDINICGYYSNENNDKDNLINKMAEDNLQTNEIMEVEKNCPKRTPSVRTQKCLNNDILILNNDIDNIYIKSNSLENNNLQSNNELFVDNEQRKTVKTQDPSNNVLEMAIALENDIDLVVDEAIKQIKLRHDETGVIDDDDDDDNAALKAMETIKNISLPKKQSRKIKNNASYELAQQWEINEITNFNKSNNDDDDDVEKNQKKEEKEEEGGLSPRRQRRFYNNPSYELAQQSDYIKIISTRQFKRMDACSELAEATSLTSADSMLSQIKKNSVIFSDSGKNDNKHNNYDETDIVPCLEKNPIDEKIKKTSIDNNINNTTNNNKNNNNNNNNNNNRQMSFLGNFYPNVNDNIRQDLSNCVEDSNIEIIQKENTFDDVVDDDDNKKMEKEKNVVAVENHEKQHNSTELCSTPTSTSDVINLHNSNIKKNTTDDTIKEMSSIAAKRLAESSSINSLTDKDIPAISTIERKEKKGGLGGFLQRFSKLRFSGRSKVPKSEINKTDVSNNKTKKYDYSAVKAEPDYIIIPLHPPLEDKKNKQEQDAFLKRPVDLERSASCLGKNGRPPVCSSKPPLPPQQQHQHHQHNLRGACAPSPSTRNNKTTGVTTNSRRRATTDLGNPIAIEMAKARTMQHHQNHQTWCDQQEQHQQHQQRPIGLLETDIDAETTNDHQRSSNNSGEKKTQSLLNLNHTSRHHHQDNTQDNINDNVLRVPSSSSSGCRNSNDHCDHSGKINQRPHKSMEFLLDKENLHFVKPPENELQKVGERVPSEHELRVQRSLQRLNVPDWYKNSLTARDGGFRLKRHSDASQHGGWRSLGSKTTSLSSLSSTSNRQNTTGPLLSPSPTPPVFSRWSTSLLNSAGSSPANSARSSFNHRQPYLGWRSQERLANPRTPAERLAQGILPQLQTTKKNQQTSQQLEVRNSIKEVTSAIVHYVQSGHESSGGVDGGGGGGENDDGRLSPRPRPDEWDDRAGGKSMSPRGSVKLCWMESSFVGTRPVDSPETPISLPTDTECNAVGSDSCSCIVDTSTSELYLNLTPKKKHTSSDYNNMLNFNKNNGICPLSRNHHHQRLVQQRQHREFANDKEDGKILASGNRQEEVLSSNIVGQLVRRKSEGSDIIPPYRSSSRGSNIHPHNHNNNHHRRVSFDNTQDNGGTYAATSNKVVRCRNNKCNNTTSQTEARQVYKSCHNCTYLYCSKECRRAHWQRHRKTCLHYRAGTLCRQILSSAKEDQACLRHISTLAKQGYSSHGRGVVKCFFSSPEIAEQFVSNGFKDLGEPTYVRWLDLLPSEMGAELYSEVMRLCKTYNPETRLVLYVAVCVVSEVPSNGAVRWERQLVSRCGKIRLDSTVRHQSNSSITASASSSSLQTTVQPVKQQQTCTITREMDSPETLVLTSSPSIDGQISNKKTREIGFTNIQLQLRQRGVSLRRHFPQVYKKLCSYVDGTVDKFAPVTIYPRDQVSGKSFMCIIMLDAEPERLQILPTDSSRVRTVDISVEQE